VSPDFAGSTPNLRVFDLFDMLAAPDGSKQGANTLRPEYRSGKRGVLGLDSHPNPRAAKVFAPLFVDFLHQGISGWKSPKKHGLPV
jgi:hypothetical protein